MNYGMLELIHEFVQYDYLKMTLRQEILIYREDSAVVNCTMLIFNTNK
jgi:hypothetical protein